MGTILTAFLNYNEWQVHVFENFVVIARSYFLAKRPMSVPVRVLAIRLTVDYRMTVL